MEHQGHASDIDESLDQEFQHLNQALEAETSARIAELQEELEAMRKKVISLQDELSKPETVPGREKLRELFEMARDLSLNADQCLTLLGTYLPEETLELLAEKSAVYLGYPNEYQSQANRETGMRNNPLETVSRILQESEPLDHLDDLEFEKGTEDFWYQLLQSIRRHQHKKGDLFMNELRKEMSHEDFSAMIHLLMKKGNYASEFALYLSFERGASPVGPLIQICLSHGKQPLHSILDRRLREWDRGQNPEARYSDGL